MAERIEAAEHVVYSRTGNLLRCRSCKGFLRLAWREQIPLGFLAEVSRQFFAEHQDCAERARHALEAGQPAEEVQRA